MNNYTIANIVNIIINKIPMISLHVHSNVTEM